MIFEYAGPEILGNLPFCLNLIGIRYQGYFFQLVGNININIFYLYLYLLLLSKLLQKHNKKSTILNKNIFYLYLIRDIITLLKYIYTIKIFIRR